ncbi:MAG: hypothetical protein KGI60_00380 [Patescibacteria group bacterium]|nr:hypothetical protein [Patescibacteria group bacterium]
MNSNKFMDVNPQKRGEGMMGDEMPMEGMSRPSRLGKLKDMCAKCYPRTAYGWLATLVGAVLVWYLLVSLSILPSLTFPLVDGGKWQAVFLSNGQVYFGHLHELNSDYVDLTNIYYLNVTGQAQSTSPNAQQQISLVKMGNELYAPEDMMNIPKSQIVHWENMQANSPVVQAIAAAVTQAQQRAAAPAANAPTAQQPAAAPAATAPAK